MVTYNVYLSNFGWSDEKHGGKLLEKMMAAILKDFTQNWMIRNSSIENM